MHNIPPPVFSPQPPWHMWGTSESFSVVIGAGGAAQIDTHQLVRVNYRRPETWRFVFAGHLTGGGVGAAGATQIYALFDLMYGVGRSISQTDDTAGLNFASFCTLHWSVPIGIVPGRQAWNRKYASSVLSPPLDDAAIATTRLPIDHIVADNIQVRCRVFVDLSDPGLVITGEVGAYFSPNVHIRPDWFAEDEQTPQFLGAETGGT